MGVLAYSPLAWGLLAGAIPANIPASAAGRLRAALAECLVPIAATHRVAPAAVALAWVMAWPGVTAAIAGSSSFAQLDEQCQALDLSLDADEIDALTRAFAGLDHAFGAPRPGPLVRVVRRLRRMAGRALRGLGARHRRQ